jgi:hypothetical protein
VELDNRIDFKKLFKVLSTDEVKKVAKDSQDIMDEVRKINYHSKKWMEKLTVEEAVKTIIWQSTLHSFGTYGINKDSPRETNKKDKHGKQYKVTFLKDAISRGKVVSVDFGVSNIGNELSLLHLAVVISDYPGVSIVIPITSQTDDKLSNIAPDIVKDFVPLLKSEHQFLENDSFLMPHQIRSISKNRITGIISSISGTASMRALERKLYTSQTKYIKKENEEEILSLNKRIDELQQQIHELEKAKDVKVVDVGF